MTFCHIIDPNNRAGLISVFKCAALVAILLGVGASSTYAVGLKYVDGLPGSSFGETPNLFRSNGTSLGTPGATDVFTSETAIGTDNAWGWRDFGATNIFYDPTPGVVDLDYASIYESLDENSPEFQARLTGANGIAASTAYDVYVAYWADLSGNWAIRAGFQPGTVASPLPVFANFNTTVAGETRGRYASSAAWDVPPLDNPTDENATGATDSNSNPFLDVSPGAPANSARNMLLGHVGTITSGSQPGAAANEIRVWIDDFGNGGAQRRSWFDGLAFVPAGTSVFVTADLDRSTGNLTLHNTTSNPFEVVSYSITSAAGTLNGSGAGNAPWNNLTAGTIPGYSDTDDDWVVAGTPSAFSTELRENDGGLPAGAQDGIVFAANDAVPLNLGNVWKRSPFQDVQVLLRLADNTPETFDDNPTVIVFPTYTGTAAARGDFNGDSVIDVMDYISLMKNLHKPQGTLVRAEYYSHGDINDNNVVDRDDYYAFRTAYFQANPGAGAAGFAAMAAEAARIFGDIAVPEPSTLWLAMLGGGFICARSRRRIRNHTRQANKESASMNFRNKTSWQLGTPLLALAMGMVLVSGAQAVPVVGWQMDPLQNGGSPNAPITDAGTNSPTIGNGTVNNADNVGVYGATASNVHLDSNFEAILNGRILMTSAVGANGRDFRWGMWKRVDNGAAQPTGAWLGYMALAGSGATPGRLEARNPDDPAFSTATFLSDVGGGSIATTAGPAPTAGSPLVSSSNVGTGTGRYFLLAEPPVNNNANYNPNVWHTFEIRVGRYGNEVNVSGSLVADAAPVVGDYNNDRTVNAADYTIWRNNLGMPATSLPNRDPANLATTVDSTHYNNWKTNFGNTGAAPYELRLGGGLDFDGRPPAAIDPNTMMPVPYTSHLTFDFDRVGFLFGNQMDADQVQLQNVDISLSPIQTLDLLVNTTTGAVQIRNNLATPFKIDYYEITSANGILKSDNWTSLDAADGGLPVTSDYLTGWDIAEGSSDFVLSEGNFIGSSTVTTGTPINLGNVFKTGTPVANRDLRFFAGVVGGGVIRGTITYSASGTGSAAAVPEPSTIWMLLVVGGSLLSGRRRQGGGRIAVLSERLPGAESAS